MIKEMVRGNILDSWFSHIVFGVNTEGFNDSGFAGVVSSKFWPELANTGGNKLGTVLSKTHHVTGKTFYAVVCHSLKEGWEDADGIITSALTKIGKETANAPIASILIGGGMIGQLSSAPVNDILQTMKDAKQEITVYSL